MLDEARIYVEGHQLLNLALRFLEDCCHCRHDGLIHVVNTASDPLKDFLLDIQLVRGFIRCKIVVDFR